MTIVHRPRADVLDLRRPLFYREGATILRAIGPGSTGRLVDRGVDLLTGCTSMAPRRHPLTAGCVLIDRRLTWAPGAG